MGPYTTRISGHDVPLSKLDKVLYPADRLTKAELIEHYRVVSDTMLPHLAGRPLTLFRYPDGIGTEGFVQKDASNYFPDWLTTVDVPRRDDGTIRHVVCDDLASLVYLTNQATIEYHVALSRQDDLARPDRLVIDIDPPDGIEVATLRLVARRLRRVFHDIGLTPFVQATGGRGFHVVAPLDRSAGFDQVRDLAAGIADHLVAQHPDLLTTAQRTRWRADRIFLDVNRNAYGQTMIAPYSLRARRGATVATPVRWNELRRRRPDGYAPRQIRHRLARTEDPWAEIDKRATAAATASDRLGSLAR